MRYGKETRRLAVLLFAVWTAVLRADSQSRELSVRILPQPVATNGASRPFRVSYPVGLLEGAGNPFQAECLRMDTLVGIAGVRVTAEPDPNSGRLRYLVSNEGKEPGEFSLSTHGLRKGVTHTLRISCRRVRGRGALSFRFLPVGADDGKAAETITVKGTRVQEKVLSVTPQKDGPYRCVFAMAPGCSMAFFSFSMEPDDAEAGFSHELMEALRTVAPGELVWPSDRDVGAYNWYDGVGPRLLRRNVSRFTGSEAGHDFGTVEFVGFCRLVGAEPVIRVAVTDGAGDAGDAVAGSGSGAQLAADWVAYCNDAGDQPLAELRRRHGHPDPLRVMRWVLTTADGGGPSPEAAAAYREAMTRVCPDLEVRVGETRLAGESDLYVAKVLRRLAAASEADRAYFTEWYTTLGLAYAGVERLRRGATGDVLSALHPEETLFRALYARNMLTEAGLVMALFNRYPAAEPLVTEGAPQEPGAPFRVQAAWAEDHALLVVFVYNSAPEARTVTLDLSPLKRPFAFWIADQLAGDISSRRVARALPVNRIQKAGAALTQAIRCEALPSSVTRIVVQEYRPKKE